MEILLHQLKIGKVYYFNSKKASWGLLVRLTDTNAFFELLSEDIGYSFEKDGTLSFKLSKPFFKKRSASITNNLAKIRVAKGLTQPELAKLSGVHRSVIANIETHTHNFSLLKLKKLCNALNVSSTDILGF
jgi:DNA-binding XRE family transcriptional regulator